MRLRRRFVLSAPIFLAMAVGLVQQAVAQETVSYTYDARGRVVTVAHSGASNNGVSASYTYDKAENRSNVTVTGVGGLGPAMAPASLDQSSTSTTTDTTGSAAQPDSSASPTDTTQPATGTTTAPDATQSPSDTTDAPPGQ